MPTIDITRPELVWPGKYDEKGNRVENRGTALPFQVIETIKEGRAINLDPNCGWAQGNADVLYVADSFQVIKKV